MNESDQSCSVSERSKIYSLSSSHSLTFVSEIKWEMLEESREIVKLKYLEFQLMCEREFLEFVLWMFTMRAKKFSVDVRRRISFFGAVRNWKNIRNDKRKNKALSDFIFRRFFSCICLKYGMMEWKEAEKIFRQKLKRVEQVFETFVRLSEAFRFPFEDSNSNKGKIFLCYSMSHTRVTQRKWIFPGFHL